MVLYCVYVCTCAPGVGLEVYVVGLVAPLPYWHSNTNFRHVPVRSYKCENNKCLTVVHGFRPKTEKFDSIAKKKILQKHVTRGANGKNFSFIAPSVNRPQKIACIGSGNALSGNERDAGVTITAK